LVGGGFGQKSPFWKKIAKNLRGAGASDHRGGEAKNNPGSLPNQIG